jgi:hypothetical protein
LVEITKKKHHHTNEVVLTSHDRLQMSICGEPAHSKCGLYDVTLHYFSKRGSFHAGAECYYILYHSDAFFGLAKQYSTKMLKKKTRLVVSNKYSKARQYNVHLLPSKRASGPTIGIMHSHPPEN